MSTGVPMINYSKSLSYCICAFTLFVLTACDSGKKEGSNKTNVDKPDVSSASDLVHPKTKMAQEKGKAFAEKVSRAWNVNTVEDKLTLKKESVLIGKQEDGRVLLNAEARCTEDGGAKFTLALFDAAIKGGMHEGIGAHGITVITNDGRPVNGDPRRARMDDYSNHYNLATIYYGLANFKLDQTLFDTWLKFEGSEQQFMDMHEIKEHMHELGMKDLQVSRGDGSDDEVYRLSVSFQTSHGTVTFHLPFYNTVVRQFIRSCSKDDENLKAAIYRKSLELHEQAKKEELAEKERATSAKASPPVPPAPASTPTEAPAAPASGTPAPAAPASATPAPAAPASGTPAIAQTEAVKPSFDCNKASTTAEKLVCSNNELAKLDVQLSDRYKTARAKAKDGDKLKADQKSWIKLVGQCKDESCVRQAYQMRLSQLQDVP